MIELHEVDRATYGHDDRAVNRHSERVYTDGAGRLYSLSRTLDGGPPFFEAHGPYAKGHEGCLPRLRMDGREYWAGGWPWKRAEAALCREIGALVVGSKHKRKEIR